MKMKHFRKLCTVAVAAGMVLGAFPVMAEENAEAAVEEAAVEETVVEESSAEETEASAEETENITEENAAGETEAADETEEAAEDTTAKDDAGEGTEDADEGGYVYEDDTIRIRRYEGLTYSFTMTDITDEEVEYAIESELESYATYDKVMEGEVADGDQVNIDYAGTLNGEAFDGGTDEDVEFIVGDGMFLEDFEDGVVGMKPGETKDIEVTFPEDYFEDTLAGQTATFAMTLNYICGEEILPELTDEWVAENTDSATVEEYRETTRENLVKEQEDFYQSQVQSEVTDQLVENTEVLVFDEDSLNSEIETMRSMYQSYASMYGMELEDFVSLSGMDAEAFEAELMEQAKSYETYRMVLFKIAEIENLEIDEEEYMAYVQTIADEYYYESAEALLKEVADAGNPDELREEFTMQKALAWVVDHAVYVPAEEDEDEDEEEDEFDYEDDEMDLFLEDDDMAPLDGEEIELAEDFEADDADIEAAEEYGADAPDAAAEEETESDSTEEIEEEIAGLLEDAEDAADAPAEDTAEEASEEAAEEGAPEA